MVYIMGYDFARGVTFGGSKKCVNVTDVMGIIIL